MFYFHIFVHLYIWTIVLIIPLKPMLGGTYITLQTKMLAYEESKWNRESDFKFLCPNPPLPKGEEAYCFGANPVGVGVTLSCLHNIFWISGWSLIKSSWIYKLDVTKNLWDFCDPDLILSHSSRKTGISVGTAVFSANTVLVMYLLFPRQPFIYFVYLHMTTI